MMMVRNVVFVMRNVKMMIVNTKVMTITIMMLFKSVISNEDADDDATQDDV